MTLLHKLLPPMRRALKDAAYKTPLARWIAPRWQFNHSPAQLGFLCECLSRARDVPGPVFEVGCYAGVTTMFLRKHMDAEGIVKPYYAFDTFEGFTADDVAYEVRERGKGVEVLTGFTDNKQEWFDRTMTLNGVGDVRSIKADVSRFDFSTLDAPAFCLVDVDLYQPVKAALTALYDRLPRGAVVVVDDCGGDARFDGALQAYREFVAARSLPSRIERGKLGFIEKP